MSKPKNPKNEVIFTILDYSKKIKKERGIELRSYGATGPRGNKAFDGTIYGFDLGYSIDKNVGVDEAKILFFSIVDELIDVLNSRESFKEYFHHYPIGYEDFYLRLNFDYDEKGHLHQNDIVMVAILDNELKYFLAEEDGATTALQSNRIIRDVYVTTGFSSKMRCVTEKLPEKN